MDITVIQEPRQTRVVIAGKASLGKLASLLQVLDVDSTTWPHDAVLLDLSRMETGFTASERVLLREHAERYLTRMKRIAIRWSEEG